jgi:hypothetical protein
MQVLPRFATRLKTALFSVARDTKHLTVLSVGLAAFGPRCDVIPFHLANLEVVLSIVVTWRAAVSSVGALLVLAFVGRALITVVKLPNAELSLVAVD